MWAQHQARRYERIYRHTEDRYVVSYAEYVNCAHQQIVEDCMQRSISRDRFLWSHSDRWIASAYTTSTRSRSEIDSRLAEPKHGRSYRVQVKCTLMSDWNDSLGNHIDPSVRVVRGELPVETGIPNEVAYPSRHSWSLFDWIL